MSGQVSLPSDCHAVAVSSAGGGIAQQYLVQFQSSADENWRRSGSYRSRQQAEHRLDELQRDGYRARVVQYGICPAAV